MTLKNLGFGFNTSFLRYKQEDINVINSTTDAIFETNTSSHIIVNDFLLQPKLYSKLTIIPAKVSASIGIGYTFKLAYVDNELIETQTDDSKFDISTFGINITPTVNYYIDESWFLVLQYDLMHVKNKSIIDNINPSLNLIKFRVGYQF